MLPPSRAHGCARLRSVAVDDRTRGAHIPDTPDWLSRSGVWLSVIGQELPGYPMPVALIGRLAVDERARGRRLGESLLIDALERVVAAAEILACLGVIVDAKDEGAERFYEK